MSEGTEAAVAAAVCAEGCRGARPLETAGPGVTNRASGPVPIVESSPTVRASASAAGAGEGAVAGPAGTPRAGLATATPRLAPSQLDLLAAVGRGEVWLERGPSEAVAYRSVGGKAVRVTAMMARLERMGLVELAGVPVRVRPDNDQLTNQPYRVRSPMRSSTALRRRRGGAR